MGFDLHREESEKDYFRFSIWGFPPIRFLAEAFGWAPEGCIATWEDDDGNEKTAECWYDTNDGQVVTTQDAENWANALKDVIKAGIIPKDVIHEESRKIDDEFMAERELIWNGDIEACANYWAGQEDYVQEFIEFLEEGEFQIY